jgi:hypothetical protein
MTLRHAYALLYKGEDVEDARRELEAAGQRYDLPTIDHNAVPFPRLALSTAIAGSDSSTLVVARFGRLALDERELDDLTAELVEHGVVLDVGGVIVSVVNDRGTSVLDTYRNVLLGIN